MTGKASLRRALAQSRATAQRARPDPGTALLAAFPQAHWPEAGAVVSGYIPFRSEVDPRPLMRALAAKGARLALPRTPPKGTPGGLTFHLCDPDDESQLEKSPWGVMEPRADLPEARPDIVLVPLLGFDAACNRLGQGQGHYDRTLARLRAQGPVLAVGLAFEAQRIDAVPVEPHDQPLDWIITPDRAYKRP